MRTPEGKVVAFTFMSHPEKDAKLRWTAKIEFPAGATAGTVLNVTVVDGNEEAVSAAVFEVAGKRLKVVDGRASLTYEEFIRGKHEVALWLHREGMASIPGGLTFA